MTSPSTKLTPASAPQAFFRRLQGWSIQVDSCDADGLRGQLVRQQASAAPHVESILAVVRNGIQHHVVILNVVVPGSAHRSAQQPHEACWLKVGNQEAASVRQLLAVAMASAAR